MIKAKNISILVFSVALSLQLVFAYAVQISFECDSLAYWNSSVGYFSSNFDLVSPYRGPVYPLAMYFLGLVPFGTPIPLLIVQFMMGATMPLLVYWTLRSKGELLALLGTTIFMVASVPFTSAKLLLAEQFFLFFVVSAIFFLQKFFVESTSNGLLRGNIKRIDPSIRSLSIFCAFALLAALTRWEGLALILSVCALLFALSIFRKSYRVPLLVSLAIFTLTLTAYGGIRASMADDFQYFGLQNGTGGQWLWRQYLSASSVPFSGSLSAGTGAFRGTSIQDVYRTSVDYVLTSDREFETLRASARDNDLLKSAPVESLRNSRDSVGLLLDAAWSKPSESGSQVTFLMSRAVVDRYGLVQADRLLQRAALDILVAEPAARTVMVNQGLALLGLAAFQPDTPIQWFKAPPINIAGCLASTGNDRFVATHNAFYPAYSPEIHAVASLARNTLRAALPVLLLVAFIAAAVKRTVDPLFAVSIVALAFNVLVVALTGGGPYGKYDLSIFTYVIVGSMSQLGSCFSPNSFGRAQGITRDGTTVPNTAQ